MQVSVSSLLGKTIGLYFSAQWCLPSHKFTPKLISIYQKIKQNLTQQEFNEEQEDFEIIYFSSDHNKLEFESSFGAMPWLALPFEDSVSKDLTKYFDIRGIPSLVIVGPDGKTITMNGRSLINLYEEEAYPFAEARVELLEKQMDEDAKNLPSMELHSGHHHELTLVSQGNGGGRSYVVTVMSKVQVGLTNASIVGMKCTPSVLGQWFRSLVLDSTIALVSLIVKSTRVTFENLFTIV